jgi:hypothetical protein
LFSIYGLNLILWYRMQPSNNVKTNTSANTNTSVAMDHGMVLHLKRKGDFDLLISIVESKSPLKLAYNGKTAPLGFLRVGVRDKLYPVAGVKIEEEANGKGKRVVFEEIVSRDDYTDEEYLEKSHLRWRDTGCLIKFAGARDLNEVTPYVAFVPNPNNVLFQGGKASKK